MTHLLQRDLMMLAGVWTVAVLIPGPNFLLIVHTAATENRTAAFAACLGCAAGTCLWVVGSLFGLAFVFAISPSLASGIRLAGAGYLIVAGCGMWFRLPTRFANPPGTGPIGSASIFRRGLVTTLANPKTVAFATSLFAVSIPRQSSHWFLLLTLATIVGISLSWYLTLASLASSAMFAGMYRRIEEPLRKAAGLAFMGFGLKLALVG